MGVQAFVAMKDKNPVNRSRRTNRYVNCVANAIIAEVGGRWEVVVFKDDSANAFALPGGKIGVHTGLLKVAKNQNQLAAVIGHEVGHVLAKHSNERMSQQVVAKFGMQAVDAYLGSRGVSGQANIMKALGLSAQYGILLPFSRTHESEADIIGLDLMAKAGFDPRESVSLWRNMAASSGRSQPEFLSTHPAPRSRIQKLQSRMGPAMALFEQARASGKRPRCG